MNRRTYMKLFKLFFAALLATFLVVAYAGEHADDSAEKKEHAGEKAEHAGDAAESKEHAGEKAEHAGDAAESEGDGE